MEWLFDGTGPMYKNPSAEASAADGAVAPSGSIVGSNDSGIAMSSANGLGSVSTDGKTAQASPSLFDNSRIQGGQVPRQGEKDIIKIVDTHPRKITEIRVFYDDQTWESFVPKNK